MGSGRVADLRGYLAVTVGPLRFAENRAEEGRGSQPAEYRSNGEREDAAPFFPEVIGGGGKPGRRVAVADR